jgi:hypothetical protein
MNGPNIIFAALVTILASAPAQASIILTATLTGDQESPPVTTQAFGTATFFLNDAQTALTFSATINGIDVTGLQTPTNPLDDLTAAHIHASSAPNPPTRPVVWGFFGLPFNDNNPTDIVVLPFATGVGGTFTGKWDLLEGQNTTLTAQIPNLLEGRAYLNFHTRAFPAGEIRGTITVLEVPEPSTLALLSLSGVALAGWWRWQKRRG